VLPRLSAFVLFGCLLLGLGFLGGRISLRYPLQNQQAITANSNPDHGVAQKDPPKTWGERLSSILNRTWDDPVAFYTFILGIFTGLLALVSAVQIGFLIRADQTARTNADATRDIAEATKAIEYPVILASYIGPELNATDELIGPNEPYGSTVNDNWPTRFSVISEIRFHNYGRTPAFPRYIRTGIAVVKKLPSVPVYTHTFPCTSSPIIEEKSPDDVMLHFGFELRDDQIAEIEGSSAILWFYAALAYQDVRGKSHETRVCWQWGRQNPKADGISYFFDDGSAPAAYTQAM
jgi:hypothetical protein